MKKQVEITAQTRKKLMDSFWQLYREKGMENVTVGAVTKLAELNRSTFYEYFTDIYDLLGQLEEELFCDIKAQVAERFQNGIPTKFEDFSHTCAKIFSRYEDKLYTLLSSRGDPAFASKLKQNMMPIIIPLLGFSEDEPNLDYLITFAFSAMTGVLTFWYENGKEKDLEELFQMMQFLVANGVLGYTHRKIFE